MLLIFFKENYTQKIKPIQNQFCYLLLFSHGLIIKVESDNLQVISKLKSRSEDGSYLWVILREIVSLASNFEHVIFNHIFR